MDHLLLARALLSMLCLAQAVATCVIDFNRTHATNPAWPGHARFHLVWQSLTVALLSLLELALIWCRWPMPDVAFYLAVILTGLSPLAFLLALTTRSIFRGTLSDPNGIPPARLRLPGRTLAIDMNLVAVVAALISLAIIIHIYRG